MTFLIGSESVIKYIICHKLSTLPRSSLFLPSDVSAVRASGLPGASLLGLSPGHRTIFWMSAKRIASKQFDNYLNQSEVVL